MDEHSLEATSGRVPGTIAHRDELWDRCYGELMANANARLAQEVARLGGHYAHVHDESIDTRHDDAAGETWLRGRFSYVLFRKAPRSEIVMTGWIPGGRGRRRDAKRLGRAREVTPESRRCLCLRWLC